MALAIDRSTELKIPTVDAKQADNLKLLQTEINSDSHLLATKALNENHTNDEPIVSPTLVQEQLGNPFCIWARLYQLRSTLSFWTRRWWCPSTLYNRNALHHDTANITEKVVKMAHHTQIAGHPRERQMFIYLGRHMFWKVMNVNVYNAVKNCMCFAHCRATLCRNASKLKLFPTTGPGAYVSADIYGTLFELCKSTTARAVVKDQFLKIAKQYSTVPLCTKHCRAFQYYFFFRMPKKRTYGVRASISLITEISICLIFLGTYIMSLELPDFTPPKIIFKQTVSSKVLAILSLPLFITVS